MPNIQLPQGVTKTISVEQLFQGSDVSNPVPLDFDASNPNNLLVTTAPDSLSATVKGLIVSSNQTVVIKCDSNANVQTTQVYDVVFPVDQLIATTS